MTTTRTPRLPNSPVAYAAAISNHCPRCAGRGYIADDNDDTNDCAACDGTGRYDYYETLTR